MINPRIQADKLKGENDLYKIKLRSAGYRLVYQVRIRKSLLLLYLLEKRERLEVYKTAEQRTAH